MQSQRNTTAAARGLLLLLGLVAVGCAPMSPPSQTLPPQPTEPAAPPKVEFIALSAKWCSVCRKVPPLFVEMRPEFPNVTFLDLDVDADERAMKLAVEHDASALPYFLVLVDGKLVAKMKGILPRADMEEFLRDALAKDAKTKK
jgi:thiol-disulfide isomerase/thioredoxin